jgi:hypothetical protein
LGRLDPVDGRIADAFRTLEALVMDDLLLRADDVIQ